MVALVALLVQFQVGATDCCEEMAGDRLGARRARGICRQEVARRLVRLLDEVHTTGACLAGWPANGGGVGAPHQRQRRCCRSEEARELTGRRTIKNNNNNNNVVCKGTPHSS